MKELIWGLVARTLAKPAIADWIIRRAKKTPYFHLASADGQDIYMERYWLLNPYDRKTNKPCFGWLPWSIRLHIIRREDQDRHQHDHPWNARTIILRGGYQEKRLAVGADRESILDQCLDSVEKLTTDRAKVEAYFVQDRKPGDTAALKFGEYHQIIQIFEGAAYTLFISGPYQGTWGFLVDGVKVPWRKYLGIPEGGDIQQADVCGKSPNGEHDFEARAPDGGAMSMSQPVVYLCQYCGAKEDV